MALAPVITNTSTQIEPFIKPESGNINGVQSFDIAHHRSYYNHDRIEALATYLANAHTSVNGLWNLFTQKEKTALVKTLDVLLLQAKGETRNNPYAANWVAKEFLNVLNKAFVHTENGKILPAGKVSQRAKDTLPSVIRIAPNGRPAKFYAFGTNHIGVDFLPIFKEKLLGIPQNLPSI